VDHRRKRCDDELPFGYGRSTGKRKTTTAARRGKGKEGGDHRNPKRSLSLRGPEGKAFLTCESPSLHLREGPWSRATSKKRETSMPSTRPPRLQGKGLVLAVAKKGRLRGTSTEGLPLLALQATVKESATRSRSSTGEKKRRRIDPRDARKGSVTPTLGRKECAPSRSLAERVRRC